jgi:hypothetical protein
LILIVLFWFLFLRETFDMPMEATECKKCSKSVFNKQTSLDKFKDTCKKLGGEYKDENNIISCENYKANLDSNYRCKCELD